MTSKKTSRLLEIRLGPPGDALDRFEAAWNRLAERERPRSLAVLSFPDLASLLKSLSPARLALLQSLREAGPVSIYALAQRLGRDYKNVHTDVSQLAALGLIERGEANRVTVRWDLLRAELRL
jgi:predicted transcriptional regulator